jgi:hypothetical protein
MHADWPLVLCCYGYLQVVGAGSTGSNGSKGQQVVVRFAWSAQCDCMCDFITKQQKHAGLGMQMSGNGHMHVAELSNSACYECCYCCCCWVMLLLGSSVSAAPQAAVALVQPLLLLLLQYQ